MESSAESGVCPQWCLNRLAPQCVIHRPTAEKDAPSRTPNPYDHEDTCTCSAWSEGECACGGYVDRSMVRAWRRGYEAAVSDHDPETAASIIASLRARLDAVSDLADHLVGNEAAPLIREALSGYVPTRATPPAPEVCSTCGGSFDSPPCSLNREIGLSGHTRTGGVAAGDARDLPPAGGSA